MELLTRLRTLTILFAALFSLGANYYLAPAPSGSDANNCSQAKPCLTPQRGISLIQDGDTLWIADGTYTAGVVAGGGCAANTLIYVGPNKGCPTNGCKIRATNITSPPSVTFVGGTAGLVINRADNWTVEGLETIAAAGLVQCSANRTTYRDMRFVATAMTTINDLFGGSGTLLERVETYRHGKPCELSRVGFGRAYAISDMQDVTISESYIGHIYALITLDRTNGFTLRRSHLEHWSNHGIVMKKGTQNVLIENNVIGGSSRSACQDATVEGPRLFDLYEVRNLTVRNNTIVGHGYTPRSAVISYYHFGNSYAGCDLSAVEPGVCEFDTNVTCTANDIPAIPGVAYSDASSQCPRRNDGLGWSPNQRCSGVCDLKNAKFYNNLVYDLRDTGEPEAGKLFVQWLSQGHWSKTTNLTFDGNYYSGGVESWICTGSNGVKTSMAEWRTAQCLGGSPPDPHGVAGMCSGTPVQACGANGDCPGAQTCVKKLPAFVNYSGGNYRSIVGATQVNAGVGGVDSQGVARCSTEDFEGKLRNDGACDIGAFELDGGDDDGSQLPSEPPGQVPNPRRSDTQG